MRSLGIHSSHFRCRARDRATDGAETVANGGHEFEIDHECAVVFVSVEKKDSASPSSVAQQLADDTLERVKRLGVSTVVIYPYVHLTHSPATPRVARRALGEIEQLLRSAGGLEVVRTPFGWYKAFEVACLGHPLSEWSGRYTPQAQVRAEEEDHPVDQGDRFHRFVIADLEGSAFEVDRRNSAECPVLAKNEPVYGLLRQLVRNELVGSDSGSQQPKHIAYMRRQALLDYCEVSEKGHFKWYPKGLLIQRLLLDYAADLARDWGAFEMRNPVVLRGDHNQIGELMGEFFERDYQVDGGRGICYLRYASDPLAFPFLQKVRFSHRQTPLRVYEEASCFRNEQQGEVSGLKRVRNFLMTDMHAACGSVEEARQEFEQLCLRFGELMNHIIAPGRWVLGWEGVSDFFDHNRNWLLDIGRRLGVPAFFKLMPRMSHYYVMKNEFQVITEDRSNIQISTVQWDIKDGERFDIGYTDGNGAKVPCPVIIHASSFGSIERTLCAILEHIAIDEAAGRPPMLPLWLSPTQVRLVPVTAKHRQASVALAHRLTDESIRADVDDRDGTLGRRVRDAEQEWVPYVVVIGDRELDGHELPVRDRAARRQLEMELDSLMALIQSLTSDRPFRPLPLPMLLSQRPIFGG